MKSLMKKLLFCVVCVFLISAFFGCKSIAEIKKQNENEKKLEVADKEIEIGKAVFAKLAGKYGVLKNEEATAYLNKLGKSIGLYTERQELEYFFGILETEQINGYALPGGYIVISVGALREVKDPGALVGILTHELGHINLKHILKHVTIEVRYNFFEILARFLAGPRQVVTSLAAEISDKVEEALFMKGLSNNDEYEADFYAINLMKSFNINPSSYIQYLEDLSKNEGIKALETLDKTHPPLHDRIDKAKALYDESMPVMQMSDDFKRFKEIIDGLDIIVDKESAPVEDAE